MSSRFGPIAVPACVLSLAVCLQYQTLAQTPKRVLQTTQKQAETQNPLISEFRFFSARVSGGIVQDKDRKIYRSGNLIRVDFDNGEYRITDLSALKMWGVTGKQCASFPKPDASSFPFSAYHDFKAERSITVEEETVDGHVCKIENVTLTPTDGRPLVIKMKLWKAKDLEGFPVKIKVDADRGWTATSTYADVSLKPPDPKLFQHPAKCTMGLGPPKTNAPPRKSHGTSPPKS